MSEFPEELIERCKQKMLVGECVGQREIVVNILRESGHPELVAGLRKARMEVIWNSQVELLAEIDVALKKAGAL